MAGKPNPLVQQALLMLKADPVLSIYEASKVTAANAQSVYAAVRRQAGKTKPEPVKLYAELEAYIRAGGEKREGARQTLAYLNRVLIEVDAGEPDAEDEGGPIDRVIGAPLTDFE